MTTADWIRNASDEQAIKDGCYFDVIDGAYAVWWIERYCRLYEGDQAGQVLHLRGCHDCEVQAEEFDEWNIDQGDSKTKRLSPAQLQGIQRAEQFAECVRARHRVDWQYDVVMRLFGWKRPNRAGDLDKSPKRRFKRASIWVSKKNKKSPTLAAIGLHLLMGDGEEGQKVFSCARDGKQAQISHTHAVEMVNKSEDLSQECTVNKSTWRITHQSSRSFYDIVAGDNKNSQEGLNGSVLVDECHVVDARLMAILKRAGRSRREPLHIEVSTAGNNPDGYGKQQFDRALRIAKGEDKDETFLSAVYAAPQDLTDAELEADPVKYGMMANPAWGHTISPNEYLHDYETSKRSISELADFKMYCLNIWQRASNPWLKVSDWAQCRGNFTDGDLSGQECIAGLDLSRVADMTALVLAFMGPDNTVRIVPKLWLPRQYAHDNNHLAPFLQWEKDGWLKFCPGNVMDYGFLKAEIRDLIKKHNFKIKELVYDLTYAEETTQTLAHGQTDNKGVEIETGIGCARLEFKQNTLTFAKPTEDFEALVLAHKLQHDGNPVMTWQAGHCEVYRDANGNRRPMKPDARKESYKKIDGIVAAIMAVSRVEVQAPQDDGKVFFV